jgi:uncharacterized protein (TIGR03435 family)
VSNREVIGFRTAIAASLFLCAGGHAQQQFEVASIKPSNSSDPRTLLQVLPGGGLRTSGATLKFLITLAYQMRSFQILGGPGWISFDRFDVIANPDRSTVPKNEPPDPTKVTAAQLAGMQDEMRPRLAALLAERCKLNVRHETREQPIFELVIAKNGPRLQGASGNFGGFHISKNQFVGNAATIDMLAANLANLVGRPVLDRTGLVGTFNFTLHWTAPDTAPPVEVDRPAATNDQSGPSVFTAVREQLGLELKSAKGPAEVLIIDHVEKPSEN